MEAEVVALVGVGGTLVGILAGRFAIRKGIKDQLVDDVKASEPIRAHIKGIATDVADKRIEAAAEKRKWLDERDAKAIDKRFDTLEEKVDDVKHSIENGLAARIAVEVGKVFENMPGARLPVRKARKNAAEP
jgi:hypothetical protein